MTYDLPEYRLGGIHNELRRHTALGKWMHALLSKPGLVVKMIDGDQKNVVFIDDDRTEELVFTGRDFDECFMKATLYYRIDSANIWPGQCDSQREWDLLEKLGDDFTSEFCLDEGFVDALIQEYT